MGWAKLWKDARARALVFPVMALQLVYIGVGSPQHSMTWHVLTAYMYASLVTYGLLLRLGPPPAGSPTGEAALPCGQLQAAR